MAKKSSAKTRPTQKYKLLRGCHGMGKGQDLVIFRPNDVIESAVDLVASCNKPGSIKFERVDPSTPATDPSARVRTQSQIERAHDDGPGLSAYDDPFDAMVPEELIAFAKAEGIDLGGKTGKEEIIKILREVAE